MNAVLAGFFAFAAIGALSASALADDERQSLALGADFFLGKPYDNRELMDGIARALEPATRSPAQPMVGLPPLRPAR